MMLYLVDGDGLLYRAANAIPYTETAGGLPNNGLRGFVSMIQGLLRSGNVTHMAVAFTADPPLRKHALDPKYKINHYEHPPEIKRQIPYAMRWVRALGAHAFLEDGFEADDIIATLAHAHPDMDIRIVSSDRDFYQLVGERVRVLHPVRGTTQMREVGPPEVVAAFGVPPAKVADLRALVGDASDDIPGVRGIGPKTAAALLRGFATVEELLYSLERITIPNARTRLEPMRDRILLNKRLAELAPVPLSVTGSNLGIGAPDLAEVSVLAEETEVRGAPAG